MKKMNKTKLAFFLLRAVAVLCLCAAILLAQTGGINTKDQNAKEVLDIARKALGGADKIGDIKSLVIKGTGTLNILSTTPSAEVGMSTEYKYETRMLLPDNFIQISQYPENFVSITKYDQTVYEGVSQGKLLNPVRISVKPGLNIPVPTQYPAGMERQIISVETGKMSRFLIGTLAQISPEQITLSPRSTPGILNMSNMPDGSSSEIEFDSKTGYPALIKFSIPGAVDGMNNEMRFSDRFSVNGIMFPRVITIINGSAKREMRIEDVQINPKLSLKDFDVPKK